MEWFTAAEKFNQALASADPTPGGGAAAAMAAAMGIKTSLGSNLPFMYLRIMETMMSALSRSVTHDLKSAAVFFSLSLS